MRLKEQISRIRRDYRDKFRHLKFLRRHLPPATMQLLIENFDELWDVEGDRYFPRVTEFPSKARRLMHPAEEDHEAWDAVHRLNIEILNVPMAKVEKRAFEWIGDEAKAGRVVQQWSELRELARAENNFIDRHIETMLHLVSQCPGRWLERDTFHGFRRLCAEIPDFIEWLGRDTALMKRIGADVEVLTRRPLHVDIIGIGEITTTIEVLGGRERGLVDSRTGRKYRYAVKKLPSFPTMDDAQRYGALFDEYQEILRDQVGIVLPPWGWYVRETGEGRAVVYNYQERLPQESNAAVIVKKITDEECRRLFAMMMAEAKKVFEFNRADTGTQLGFDAQLPNWCLIPYDPAKGVTGRETMTYIDTSTPLMRRGGPDLLDTEIFLKIVPAPLRPIVRGSIMKEVLDRYYISRDVITDIIASFYLYERPDMVPVLVEDANAFIEREMSGHGIEPFTEKAMASYHRQDTMIWVFFRTVKRLDRFVKEKILRRPFEQRLPRRKFVPGPYSGK